MLTAEETARSLYGAWRLARFDAGGMALFDRTPEGFWRSFRVAVLMAPPYALLILLQRGAQAADPLRFALVELIAYVIAWTAFPLAMAHIVKAVDREADYIGFVVAYNWANALQLGLFVLVAMVAASGLLPPTFANLLGFAAILAVLGYAWFIAKAGLRLGALGAAGIVLFDVMLNAFISGVADGLRGP